jgi:hypothetical protein
MSHKQPDGDSCKNYFKYGKSFPDNVEDAICNASGIFGSTGPTGPEGPAGPSGVGAVNFPAILPDILAGVNGVSTNRTISTYVDPSGWYHASNQYAPLVVIESLTNETYQPDALNTVIFDITYNGACLIAAPKNMANGRTITICLRQGAGGNHSINWDPVYHFDGGYKFITENEGAKDVMVGTKINDFVFSTIASDCKNTDSTILGQSSTIVY